MPIPLTCPGCRSVFDVPDELAGKTIRCTTCQTQVKVTAAAGRQPTPAPRPAPTPGPRPSPVAAKPPAAKPARRRDDDEDDFDDDLDDRPRPKKKGGGSSSAAPLIIGAAVLGVLLLAGGGVAAVFLLKGDAKPSAGNNSNGAGGSDGGGNDGGGNGGATTPGGGATTAAGGWTAVATTDADGFKAEMPGTATASAMPGAAGGRQYQYKKSGAPEEAFVVGYIDLPRAVVAAPGFNRDTILATSIQEAARGMRMSSLGQANVGAAADGTLGGHPAKQVSVSPSRGKGFGQVRVTLVENRLFIAGGGGDAYADNDPRVERFFNSVQISYTPPPLPGSQDSDWQPVEGADGFTATMPGKPSTQLIGTVKQWVLRLDLSNESYQILTSDFGRPFLDPRFDKGKHLEREGLGLNSFAFQSGSGCMANPATDITVNGFPGKEVRFTPRDGSGKGGGVARVVLAGDRQYRLFAGGNGLGADSPRIQKFFDGFQITYQPPPPPDPLAKGPNPPFPNGGGTGVMGTGGPPTAGGGGNLGFFGAPGGSDPMNPNPPPNPNAPREPMPGEETKPTVLAKVNPFWAGVFTPDGKEFYTVTHRGLGAGTKGTLTRYSVPDFRQLGSYQLPNLAVRAVIDPRKNLLYLAAVTKLTGVTANLMYERPQLEVSLQGFDLGPVTAGKLEESADLKALWSVPIAGRLAGMEAAPDGKGVCLLTNPATSSGKTRLALFDPVEKKITKTTDLPEPAAGMIPAPDGKHLLVVEVPMAAGRPTLTTVKPVKVMVADAVTLTKVRSVPLPSGTGPTNDLAVGPDGRMVSATIAADGQAVRLHDLPADGAGNKEMNLGTGWRAANNAYVRLSPDGRRLYAASSGGPGFDVYDVDGSGGATKVAACRTGADPAGSGELPLGGCFHLTPDGAHAVFRTGAVVETSQFVAAKADGLTDPKGPPPEKKPADPEGKKPDAP